MAFEVITVAQFFGLFGLGLAFFAAAIAVGKFLAPDPGESMVPNVIHGLFVGLLAIFGTVSVGMSIGFGCADPDYYEDEVKSPEEELSEEEEVSNLDAIEWDGLSVGDTLDETLSI